jgi:hypothetical protein
MFFLQWVGVVYSSIELSSILREPGPSMIKNLQEQNRALEEQLALALASKPRDDTPFPDVEIVMVDNRMSHPDFFTADATNEHLNHFWYKTAAINHHYAVRHNYSFSLWSNLDPNSRPVFALPWVKIPLYIKLLERTEATGRPRVFLFLDSDAFVSAPLSTVESWLRGFGLYPAMLDAEWSMLFSREGKMDSTSAFEDVGDESQIQSINAGVAVMYVDPKNTSRTAAMRRLLGAWRDSSCNFRQAHGSPTAPYGVMLPGNRQEQAIFAECGELQKDWPAEQKCLQDALVNGVSEIPRVVHVPELQMNWLNGPWGIFVRHMWGDKRTTKKWVFDDMLNVLNVGPHIWLPSSVVEKDLLKMPDCPATQVVQCRLSRYYFPDCSSMEGTLPGLSRVTGGVCTDPNDADCIEPNGNDYPLKPVDQRQSWCACDFG